MVCCLCLQNVFTCNKVYSAFLGLLTLNTIFSFLPALLCMTWGLTSAGCFPERLSTRSNQWGALPGAKEERGKKEEAREFIWSSSSLCPRMTNLPKFFQDTPSFSTEVPMFQETLQFCETQEYQSFCVCSKQFLFQGLDYLCQRWPLWFQLPLGDPWPWAM